MTTRKNKNDETPSTNDTPDEVVEAPSDNNPELSTVEVRPTSNGVGIPPRLMTAAERAKAKEASDE